MPERSGVKRWGGGRIVGELDENAVQIARLEERGDIGGGGGDTAACEPKFLLIFKNVNLKL